MRDICDIEILYYCTSGPIARRRLILLWNQMFDTLITQDTTIQKDKSEAIPRIKLVMTKEEINFLREHCLEFRISGTQTYDPDRYKNSRIRELTATINYCILVGKMSVQDAIEYKLRFNEFARVL